MKLRNLVPVFAIVSAALFVTSNEVQAGGDMSAGNPEDQAGVERPIYPREQYGPPYPREQYRPPYPYEQYRPSYGYGYGYGHEYGYERTYVIGSYYRPYRTHYYSYSYRSPRPQRRDPLRTIGGLLLPWLIYRAL